MLISGWVKGIQELSGLKLLYKSTIASKFKDDNNVEQDFSTSGLYTDILGQIILCREGLFYA